MSVVTAPVGLTVGKLAQIPLPQNPGQLASVVMANMSPYLLTINTAANTYYLQPWEEAQFPVVASTAINALPTQTSGTNPAGASSQINCTWYLKGEKAIGTWPVSLVANALAAEVSGGEIQITGPVPVTNSDGGSTLPTAPATSAGYGTAQQKVVATGTAIQLPSIPSTVQGVFIRALKSNAQPVYLGDSTVTTGNGFQLAPDDVVPAAILASNADVFWINGTAGDGVSILAL